MFQTQFYYSFISSQNFTDFPANSMMAMMMTTTKKCPLPMLVYVQHIQHDTSAQKARLGFYIRSPNQPNRQPLALALTQGLGQFFIDLMPPSYARKQKKENFISLKLTFNANCKCYNSIVSAGTFKYSPFSFYLVPLYNTKQKRMTTAWTVKRHFAFRTVAIFKPLFTAPNGNIREAMIFTFSHLSSPHENDY